MSLHRERTHPTYVPDCFACRIATVGVSADAMQTRKPRVASSNALERQWQRDMPAYKRLRSDGLQPNRIDGSARLEKEASTPLEVQMGKTFGKRANFAQRFHEELSSK